jgi:hypothetical protein
MQWLTIARESTYGGTGQQADLAKMHLAILQAHRRRENGGMGTLHFRVAD